MEVISGFWAEERHLKMILLPIALSRDDRWTRMEAGRWARKRIQNPGEMVGGWTGLRAEVWNMLGFWTFVFFFIVEDRGNGMCCWIGYLCEQKIWVKDDSSVFGLRWGWLWVEQVWEKIRSWVFLLLSFRRLLSIPAEMLSRQSWVCSRYLGWSQSWEPSEYRWYLKLYQMRSLGDELWIEKIEDWILRHYHDL